MAPTKAQADLAPRITGTARDAERVAEAMRLFAMVLLRDDSRVQREYETWRARAEGYEDAGDFTEAIAITEAAAIRFLLGVIHSAQRAGASPEAGAVSQLAALDAAA